MLETMKEQITKDFAEVSRRYQLPDEKINQRILISLRSAFTPSKPGTSSWHLLGAESEMKYFVNPTWA